MTVAEAVAYVTQRTVAAVAELEQQKVMAVRAMGSVRPYRLRLDGVTIATHYAREDSDAVEYFAEYWPEEFSYSDSIVVRG